jgi:Tol biopolymer transport system component
MWPDGTDQRELCLAGIWEGVNISPDGKTLAWDSVNGSESTINVAKADASDQRELSLPAGANLAPSFSGDGEQIAFLHSPRDDGRYDVWTSSSEALTEEAEQVTAIRNVSYVAWSPADDWLAYVKDWSEETLEGEIVLVRPNGDDERLLGRGDEPSWAPDGKQLVLVRDGGLWTVATDGSETRLLVRNAQAPAWSRDGKLIAFMREERCGKPICKARVFVAFADGTSPRAIGPAFMGARRIIWLPDPHE